MNAATGTPAHNTDDWLKQLSSRAETYFRQHATTELEAHRFNRPFPQQWASAKAFADLWQRWRDVDSALRAGSASAPATLLRWKNFLTTGALQANAAPTAPALAEDQSETNHWSNERTLLLDRVRALGVWLRAQGAPATLAAQDGGKNEAAADVAKGQAAHVLARAFLQQTDDAWRDLANYAIAKGEKGRRTTDVGEMQARAQLARAANELWPFSPVQNVEAIAATTLASMGGPTPAFSVLSTRRSDHEAVAAQVEAPGHIAVILPRIEDGTSAWLACQAVGVGVRGALLDPAAPFEHRRLPPPWVRSGHAQIWSNILLERDWHTHYARESRPRSTDVTRMLALWVLMELRREAAIACTLHDIAEATSKPDFHHLDAVRDALINALGFASIHLSIADLTPESADASRVIGFVAAMNERAPMLEHLNNDYWRNPDFRNFAARLGDWNDTLPPSVAGAAGRLANLLGA